MNNMKKLDHLAPIADEMLAGLQADEAMRLRIVRAARAQGRPERKAARRFAPAMAAAAALLVCVGVAATQLGDRISAPGLTPMAIDDIAAGEPMVSSMRMAADLGDGANVSRTRAAGGSLFAEGDGEFPVVAYGGNIYRMLSSPASVSGGQLGGAVGSVSVVTGQPSLASAADLAAGMSNVAAQASAIHAVSGLDDSTAVAAEVNGQMRLFQRVSYAGIGANGDSFEDTFSVRGQVSEMTLDGVGTLTGDKANDVMAVLLDKATLRQADAGSARQYLTVTLKGGIRLQLAVLGDMLCGCGGWSCPEFFEAFEAAL